MFRPTCTFAFFALIAACAPKGPDPTAAAWRERLQALMQERVSTRAQRDEHSRVLVDAVEHDALEGLDLAQVQAQFGHGQPCSEQALCAEQGFSGDDLYFQIGEIADDSIKQLPVLIVGFDTHGMVKRVYTLKTH
jgi:hypothetical protein